MVSTSTPRPDSINPAKRVVLWAALPVVGGFIGWLSSSEHRTVVAAVVAIGITTGFAPFALPALLLVGAGVLHVITYLTEGLTTRGDVLSSPTSFLPFLIALFAPPIVVTAVRSKTEGVFDFLRRGDPRRTYLMGAFLLLILLAFRLYNTLSPVYGATKTLGFAAFSVAPSILIIMTIRSSRELGRAVWAIFLGGGVWVTFVLMTAIMRGDLNLYENQLGEAFGGTTSTGGGIGGGSGLVALAGLGLVLKGGRALPKVALMMVAIAVLVFSGHRASTLGFLVGLSVILMTTIKGSERRSVLLLRVLFVLLVLFGATWYAFRSAPTWIETRFQDPISQSFQERVSAQTLALRGWESSPFIGHGTGSSSYFVAGMDQPVFGEVRGFHPHNVTIELLVEVGLLGAAIYLVTIFVNAGRGYRALGRASEDRWLLPILLAFVAQSFVISQAGTDLTIQNDMWITSTLLAIGTAAVPGKSKPDQPAV